MSLFKKRKREVLNGTCTTETGKDLGNVIAIFDYVDNKPIEVEIIPLDYNSFFGLNLMRVSIETEHELFYLHFKKVSHNGTITGIVSSSIIIRKFENEGREILPLRITLVLPKIGFLNFEINRFIHDCFNDLSNSKEITERHVYELKGLNNFRYKPFVDIRYDEDATGFQTIGMNTFEYSSIYEKEPIDHLNDAKVIGTKMLRVINILCKSDSNIESIHINEGSRNLLNSYVNQEESSFAYNNLGISEKAYFAIIKQMFESVFDFNGKSLELFWGITNRMIRLKKETDLTIMTVLLHSVLQLLMKSFDINNKLYSKDLTIENFKKLDISIDVEESVNLSKFDTYRNKFFKQLPEVSKFYDPIVYKESYNVTLKFIGILLSKFFSINKECQNDFYSILRFVHSYR